MQREYAVDMQFICVAHKNFQEEHAMEYCVVYSTFSKFQPRHVVTPDKIKLRELPL